MNYFNFGPPAYPLDKFPVLVRETARELSWHLQAPDALIAMSLLAVMSAACQGRIKFKLPTGQVRPVSLNIFAIAESGERKSALDDLVAKALYDFVARRQAAHDLAMEQYERDLAMWDDVAQVLQQKRSALIRKGKPTDEVTMQLAEHRKIKPARPRMRKMVHQDLTGRAFADAINGNGESIAWMSAEGDILLRSGAMKQLGWLNSAWDGSTLTLDRADGKSVVARNPRVTISLMAQPSAFRQHMARHGEQARGTGLLARFLVGWPASTQGKRFLSAAEPSWDNLTRFHERVGELLDEYDQALAAGSIDQTILTFTEDATTRWIKLVNDAEQLIRPEGAYHDINDVVSKASEMVGRVAAILHYFSEQEGAITLDTLERAIVIVGWHVDEFQRIFSETSDTSIAHGDANILARHFHTQVWQKGGASVRRNDILRFGPVALRVKRRLDPALDILVANGAVWTNRDRRGRCYVNLNGQFFNNFFSF
jgi:hypothetical protein